MKRRIKLNVWGNWIGYIGRERVHTFDNEWDANYWLEHGKTLYED